MADDRRPTIWERAVGEPLGDLCGMCTEKDCEQRKVRTPAGWEICPHCDRGLGEHLTAGKT